MNRASPKLSFAIPVRNGETTLPRTLDSLLAQDFDDFEVVISDNASSDGTREVCDEYARDDSRIRYERNPEDLGQILNFNRVLERSTGEYVRWIGANDIVYPAYATQCIASLEANPDAIGVTTLWEFLDANGERHHSEYRGERLESPDRLHRIARFLWFMAEDRLHLDPIYCMFRREALARTKQLQVIPHTDLVLAFELALQGRFCHVAEVLACRKLPEKKDPDVEVRTYHRSLRGADRLDRGLLYAEFKRVVAGEELATLERLKIYFFVWYFRLRERPYRAISRLRRRAGRFWNRAFR